MTEVLTTAFAPMFAMLILVLLAERFFYACLMAADFAARVMRDPQQPARPVRMDRK